MQETTMAQLWQSGHISAGNAAYVEELYEKYLEDPASIPDQWRSYFETLPLVEGTNAPDISHATIRDHFLLLAKNQARVVPVSAASISADHERKQFAVSELINGYRRRGHLRARLDPLGLQPQEQVPLLTLEHHQLSAADLDTSFQTGNLFFGKQEAQLREIVQALEQTYCGAIGAEYMHITNEAETAWVQQRMESARSLPSFTDSFRQRILDRLIAAEGLEKYLGTKYPGTKRFGLEGGESLIPCMAELVQRAGASGIAETVIGMAHRGRINVLVNLLGKDPADLFDEFEGRYQPGFGSGDVKYHQGFSSNVMTPGGEMHLALGFNPSHLEIVAPVIEGSVRARMDRRQDGRGSQVLAINVHGDAALAGQGVVMETFQMSQTRGFYTGGTIHIVINNQIGYTISEQVDARSTHYCTEVAKMVQAPIFHVNGDDPEAVVFIAQLALDYRMEFNKDVVIDMVCYRRRGHNEGDEPSITQPIMYQQIRQHPTTLSLYADRLMAVGALTREDYEPRLEAYRQALDEGHAVAWDSVVENPDTSLHVDWTPYIGHEWHIASDTSLDLRALQKLAARLDEMPDGFVPQKQVARLLDDRHKMTAGALPVNWGYAEILAYGTLLAEGHNVRLTGQDVGRGTFAHRHAVLHDQKTGNTWVPLKQLEQAQLEQMQLKKAQQESTQQEKAQLENAQPEKAQQEKSQQESTQQESTQLEQAQQESTQQAAMSRFSLYDSLLSEEAVLAFEYGYSSTSPTTLVIWEAQFGDFANGAQVVIDQFITSGEHKWARLSGLTMLLPHGYEGAGPEHSSARIERYLQLAAENNIQICVPTTPAQIYHLLRRQSIRPLRRPLIVISPKSLLRHKEAVSTLEELAEGQFMPIIDDDGPKDNAARAAITRLIFCSGKIYYDIRAKREAEGLHHAAIIRIEQLYPFAYGEFNRILQQYPNVQTAVWCQEEPRNQGAWYSGQHRVLRVLNHACPGVLLTYAGREPSAAAAAGYMSLHLKELEMLLHDAFHTDSID